MSDKPDRRRFAAMTAMACMLLMLVGFLGSSTGAWNFGQGHIDIATGSNESELLPGAGATEDNKRYENNSISFQYPDSYKIYEEKGDANEGSVVLYKLVPYEDLIFTVYVNINWNTAWSKMNPEDLLDIFVNLRKENKNFTNVDVYESSPAVINGNKAARRFITLENLEGDPLKEKNVAFISNRSSRWMKVGYMSNTNVAPDDAFEVVTSTLQDTGAEIPPPQPPIIPRIPTVPPKKACESNEPPIKDFEKTYGGLGQESFRSVAAAADGSYILAGKTDSSGSGEADLWLMKIDSSGSALWDKTFGGTMDDAGNSVVLTSDAEYLVVGSSETPVGGKDLWLLKVNKKGGQEWEKRIGSSADEEGYYAMETKDGGYVVTGYTRSIGSGGKDLWVLKLERDRSIRWSKPFGGAGDEEGRMIKETAEGGYIVVGTTKPSASENSDIWMLRLDSNGTKKWERKFGGQAADEGCSVILTKDGGYMIGGLTKSQGAGGFDLYLIKTNSQGESQWERTFGGLGDESGCLVTELSDGYIVLGTTRSSKNGPGEAWLIKIDGNGDKQWDTTFGGMADEEALGIAVDKKGDYLIVGSKDVQKGNKDGWLVKAICQ